ncbi:unnamed protein product [Ilex paraguariensis]|uniref:Uncharacterized protein n=1 Tax=Ilex paraguariensis TaxID=185542 RepID=A0ABC8T8V6_9AQUA
MSTLSTFLILDLVCLLSLLFHCHSREATDSKLQNGAVNVSELRSKESSFADMFDRALNKEFNDTNEQSEATDPGSFNNSVAGQQVFTPGPKFYFFY